MQYQQNKLWHTATLRDKLSFLKRVSALKAASVGDRAAAILRKIAKTTPKALRNMCIYKCVCGSICRA